MNSKTKKRLVVVTGVIIMVLILILALVGGNTAAKNISVAEAASGDYDDKRIQVSGNVVENSYEMSENNLIFDIYDPDGDPHTHLRVIFDGGASATFGNDVTAICTGKIDESGILRASELVTKCPSKYESATDALTVTRLVEYGETVIDKPVKIAGQVKAGTLVSAGQGDRMTLVDEEGTEIAIEFDGALSEEIVDGSSLVITGSLNSSSKFSATDVALEG